MKIYTCSNWQKKFLGLVIQGWEAQGHEVKYSVGYDPALHEWSEVTFIDVCDNNAIVASRQRFPARTVIRAIDIECWVHQPGGVTWENIDGVIFGAKHIEEYVRSYVNFPDNVEVRHVPFGVDVNAWSYKRHVPGSKVAMVAHRWTAKNIPLLLQVMHRLGPSFSLHLLGTPSSERWLHPYIDHMIEKLGINCTIENHVDDLNEWLEDKNYIIHSSMKETFSYACAEAAAKGIRPLIHAFYGAELIWPRAWLWYTVQEVFEKVLNGEYDSGEYRQYIVQNYSLDKMMAGINGVCRIS